MKEVIRVVGAVIFDPQADSYFVGQRSKLKKHPLKWEFIGGKVEKGENLLQATQREFKEETGLQIKALKLIESNRHDYGGEIGIVEINFVECEMFNQKMNFDPEVYETCKWVPRRELDKLDWLEADKKFVLSLI